jgi:RHH-type transcriptional regulator, proline utilization regulon repressor / proline dehydrogenase / delta 1-pyrroline-5-carboxylate dehydrogenase
VTEAEPVRSPGPEAGPPDRPEGVPTTPDCAETDQGDAAPAPHRPAADPREPAASPDRAATDRTAIDPDGAVMERAEVLAAGLLAEADIRRSRREKSQSARLARLLSHPEGRSLILALTDEVLRIRDPERAAAVLRGLAEDDLRATGLGSVDRAALTAGGYIGSALPRAVIPAVRQRVRREMSGVILPASPGRLARHVDRRRRQGIRLNVNILGEAVLGEDEARARLGRVVGVLSDPAVDYVSVKISSICSQLEVLAFDHEVDRIAERLRTLYERAGRYRPAKFVNLDMEEYQDLDLTLSVFRKVLDEERFLDMEAGIVLQAYLPDSLPALDDLCGWARSRHRRGGAAIKVRLVKGANLAMELVDAELHGWPAAPFASKEETDANYKRMLDVALDPVNDPAVRVGVASHNLFELAWAASMAAERGATHRTEFEMLEGMSPAAAEAAADRFGGLLLYAPLVARGELEAAIAYLVRRLDENSGLDNFITHQFSMSSGSPVWETERRRFRRSVIRRHEQPAPTNRVQNRRAEEQRPVSFGATFANEPDTDFTLEVNREWARGHLRAVESSGRPEYRPVVAGRVTGGPATETGTDPSRPGTASYAWRSADIAEVEEAIATARSAGTEWWARPASERQKVLLGAAASLARRRGRLLAVMAYDTGKTLREGDPEVSEAIDFATYYAGHVTHPDLGFRPHGTVVVASPWNFPLSIPAGGVLAALAAGNAVILKPAPEAVAVGGELVHALWEGGVPRSVLQFVPCVDGDASRRLITDPAVDAVVLTGSWDTARMFLQWRPGLALHAETSGKNAIVITATADLDEAIADLVHSAFGHAGQKCSAASLAIVERSVHDDPRFLSRLADATRSLRPGPAWEPSTTMGPLIRPPEGPLRDAVSRLEPGERWLVRPERLDEEGFLWSPGIKVGVDPGSPFHLTECFGPVLGMMRAADLDEAVAWQNQTPYGLTAGLQGLDPAEIGHWRERVEAGNLYVNRGITGALVRRQPFGGWKRSVVGPGAKAGGPNYVASLGTWAPSDPGRASPDRSAFESAWARLARPRDFTGLAAESNVFRYRALGTVALRIGAGVPDAEVGRARMAADVIGVTITDGRWRSAEPPAVDKVRFLGPVDDAERLAAIDAGLWVDDTPVAAEPERELLRWVREQAVSESRHRHGNITDRRPGLVPAPDAADAADAAGPAG